MEALVKPEVYNQVVSEPTEAEMAASARYFFQTLTLALTLGSPAHQNLVKRVQGGLSKNNFTAPPPETLKIYPPKQKK